uniref:Uncharacterized protein n=1 Tax=Aegilops tauschii subsp. strangulata TaxID=200361 RepID=A0A453RPJ0_AEGTS
SKREYSGTGTSAPLHFTFRQKKRKAAAGTVIMRPCIMGRKRLGYSVCNSAWPICLQMTLWSPGRNHMPPHTCEMYSGVARSKSSDECAQAQLPTDHGADAGIS